MTVAHVYSGLFNKNNTPEEVEAAHRQSYVNRLARCISSASSGWFFPDILVEAIEKEVWKKPRMNGPGNMIAPMPLAEFITTRFPEGLGTTMEIVARMIADSLPAKEAWDRALRAEHGGAHNPHGLGGKSGKTEASIVKSDNVTLDNSKPEAVERHGGNSQQEGLRRLDKAAKEGHPAAIDLRRRVLDPDDPMTVNGACVAMGWRKPTRTVVDTADGLAEAVVRKIGPLDTIKQAFRRASQVERASIRAWVAEQPVDDVGIADA